MGMLNELRMRLNLLAKRYPNQSEFIRKLKIGFC